MCNFEGQISQEHIVFFFRGQNSKLTALCHHANWGLLFMFNHDNQATRKASLLCSKAHFMYKTFAKVINNSSH